jgi:hypothetical protein
MNITTHFISDKFNLQAISSSENYVLNGPQNCTIITLLAQHPFGIKW